MDSESSKKVLAGLGVRFTALFKVDTKTIKVLQFIASKSKTDNRE
jgi:hypothetical protein